MKIGDKFVTRSSIESQDDVIREWFIPDTEGNRNRTDMDRCTLDCGNPDCMEWPDIWSVYGKDQIYHLGECNMIPLSK